MIHQETATNFHGERVILLSFMGAQQGPPSRDQRAADHGRS